MTLTDVINKHRAARGADQLRATLGPEATPEALDRDLTRLFSDVNAWAAYRPEEIEAAKVARLRSLLGEISTLAAKGDTSRIWDLTDMIADVDIEADTAWMRAEREKRGEPLPVAA
ncbi:hypothetical protein [Leisingera caerulea]|uniref:hypothetical protein n=1 Tax=Leisingera caerulea TaxID=506591 RepID=UPI000429A4D0|nr:hypothetical protein [Leisingera caerulea]